MGKWSLPSVSECTYHSASTTNWGDTIDKSMLDCLPVEDINVGSSLFNVTRLHSDRNLTIVLPLGHVLLLPHKVLCEFTSPNITLLCSN